MNFTYDLEKAMKYYSTSGGFLSVKAGDKINTMTVEWGYIGFLWNKPYFVVFVRPQRYTKQLIDKAESFTVSIPYGTMSEELKICGTKSGADIDKSKVVNFIPAKRVNSPVVSGCNMYYECKINYKDSLLGEKMPEDVRKRIYRDDYHDMYFGEIVENYAVNV